MTNIDPSRLTAIFRNLSTTETPKNTTPGDKDITGKKNESSPSVEIKKNASKSKGELKKQLAARLIKLNQQDASYSEKAPVVVVREILLWEFGENMLNHPEFNHLTQLIVTQVKDNEELTAYLEKLIDSLTNR